MTNPPELPPSKDRDPISDAAHQIAAIIHQGFVSEVMNKVPVDFEDVIAAQSERYPYLLYGELAMHIAEVNLPPDATAAERAKGIVEAMRRIASTPSLFEAVTGAPFKQESTPSIQRLLDKVIRGGRKEATAVDKLRTAISRNGYLEQSMIPDGRSVQFQYTGSSAPKKRRFRSNVPAVPQEVILQAVPALNQQWTVKTYGHWDSTNGFTKPKGDRTVYLPNVFTLLAVESSGLEPSQSNTLQNMVGSSIRLGKVSIGTLLKIDYNFTRKTQEVPGYEPSIKNYTWIMPLALEQAYLGATRDLPLFSDV